MLVRVLSLYVLAAVVAPVRVEAVVSARITRPLVLIAGRLDAPGEALPQRRERDCPTTPDNRSTCVVIYDFP